MWPRPLIKPASHLVNTSSLSRRCHPLRRAPRAASSTPHVDPLRRFRHAATSAEREVWDPPHRAVAPPCPKAEPHLRPAPRSPPPSTDSVPRLRNGRLRALAPPPLPEAPPPLDRGRCLLHPLRVLLSPASFLLAKSVARPPSYTGDFAYQQPDWGGTVTCTRLPPKETDAVAPPTSGEAFGPAHIRTETFGLWPRLQAASHLCSEEPEVEAPPHSER